MPNLESTEVWPELVQLKDQMSLKELADRYDTTPGAIAGAFERTRTIRTPPRAPNRALELGLDDDLPPEPGEPSRADLSPEVQAAIAKIRPGSKDVMIAKHAHQLGQIPDAEVAKLAGVSVRTIASFRARHGIGGYRGPRRSTGSRGPRRSRIDPFAEMLGQVPDRVVAEKAGVSLNAVRNYRVKRGIPAARRASSLPTELPSATPIDVDAPPEARSQVDPAGAAPRPQVTPQRRSSAAQSGAQHAWRVKWRDMSVDAERERIVLAGDLVEAAQKLKDAGIDMSVTELAYEGAIFA